MKKRAPIEHSIRANAVTGPANSIEMMRSVRASLRLEIDLLKLRPGRYPRKREMLRLNPQLPRRAALGGG